MKTGTKVRGLFCAVFILTTIFTSCARQIPVDSIYAQLKAAVESSLQYKTYYIQEMKTHDGLLDKKTVNLRCELDDAYQPIIENGRYKEYQAEIHVSKNDLETLDILCGVSKSASGDEKNALFRTEYIQRDEQAEPVTKTVTEIPIEDFINGSEFQQYYAINSFLGELHNMSESDFDFTGEGAKAESKNNLTVLGFSVTADYLSRYEAETGKKSVFAGSDRVEVELIYGRVASVVTFFSYSDAMFNQTIEESPYKLFITYYGPKFEIPPFDTKDDKGEDEWDQIIKV